MNKNLQVFLGGGKLSTRNQNYLPPKKSLIASALFCAFFANSAFAQIPEAPTLPDNVDWSTDCPTGSSTCVKYSGTADKSKLQTLFMPQNGGNAYIRVSKSLAAKSLERAGDASDYRLVVTNMDDLTGVVYATTQRYSESEAASTAPIGQMNNNSVLIQLDNRDQEGVALAGISYGQAWFAAVSASELGQASSNSLLIKNSALKSEANGQRLLFAAVSTDRVKNATGQSGSKVASTGVLDNNLTILDNVSLQREPGSNTRVDIGAVINVDRSNLGSWLSDAQMNGNQLFIMNGSDLDADLVFAVFDHNSDYRTRSDAASNLIYVSDSKVSLGGLFRSWPTEAPIVATAYGTDSAVENTLYIASSAIEINYDQTASTNLSPTIGTAYSVVVGQDNTSVLKDVDFTVQGTPQGDLQTVKITGASATSAQIGQATEKPLAANNSLYVVGETKKSNLQLVSGVTSLLTGAEVVVTLQETMEAEASANTATIENVDLGTTEIYGARSLGYKNGSTVYAGTALVDDNHVNLKTVTATQAAVVGGHTIRGTASNNTVTLEGADITKAVLVGGAAQEYGSASGNTVTVGDARLGEGSSIYGGWVRTGAADNTAENNTIVLQDNVTGTGGGVLKLDALYGGFAQTAADGANTAFVGNKLYNSTRVETKALGGIQQYNFITTQAQLDAGALITVTGTDAVVIEPTGANASTVAVGGADIALQAGTTYTLIDSAAGFTDLAGTQLDQTTNLDAVKQDLTVTSLPSVFRVQTNTVSKDDYDLKIEAGTGASGGDSLVMTVAGEPGTDLPGGSSSINDQTNTLVESALSTLATTIAADDLFVDSVLRSRTGARQGLFAAARAGKYSYDTNTRLETNIVQGLLGFGASLGSTNVGGFIEMGHGSYDSRMNSLLGDVTGEGSQNFAGVGVYVDYGLPIDGWRLTGYIKGGQIDNSFNARIAGVNAGYDEENFYWGAHLGTHYDFDVADLMRARVFLSYFYNGVDSSSYDIAGNAEIGGAHISIDSINAHRVQAGSMLEFLPGSNLRPYLGLTVEQTIAAEASGTATDAKGTMDLNASDLEGTTGILSAGWTYSAGSFSTELGLNGYAGTRNGFSGQIQASWMF